MMCKNLGHWFFQMLLKSMAITKQKWDAWYWTRSRSLYRIYLFMALKFPCSLKISSLGYIEKKKKREGREREKFDTFKRKSNCVQNYAKAWRLLTSIKTTPRFSSLHKPTSYEVVVYAVQSPWTKTSTAWLSCMLQSPNEPLLVPCWCPYSYKYPTKITVLKIKFIIHMCKEKHL